MKNLGLIPLSNFGIVDKDALIFRCAQPHTRHDYDWIDKVLGVQTIVNLRSEKHIDSRMALNRGFRVINIDIPDHHEPTAEQALGFMKLIKAEYNKQKNYPMLIHCEHGRGRTSTFCVLVRLAQGWTLKEAVDEENKKFHYAFQHPVQLKFLEKFYKEHILSPKTRKS